MKPLIMDFFFINFKSNGLKEAVQALSFDNLGNLLFFTLDETKERVGCKKK